MTDLERRLQEAGREWREHPAVRAAVERADDARIPGRHRPGARLVVTAAAAVVVVAAAGAVAAVRAGAPTHSGSASTTGSRPRLTVPARATGLNGSEAPDTDLAALAVHDGDTVDAYGDLAGSATTGWMLCLPYAVADVGVGSLDSTGAPSRSPSESSAPCGPNKVADLIGSVDAARAGQPVILRGTLHDSAITVTDMIRDTRQEPRDSPLPCPTPSGGWVSEHGTSDNPDADAAGGITRRHPDQYGDVWISWTTSGPLLPNAEGGRGHVGVLAVGTTIDVGTARSQLQAAYHGPLCVYRVPFSSAQIESARAEARNVFGSDLYQAAGSAFAIDRVDTEVRLVTDAQARALASVQGRLSMRVHVVPVGRLAAQA